MASKQQLELRKKWVEALRSGKYKQGKFRLVKKVDDGFCHCCLGVLCEVAGLKPIQEEDYMLYKVNCIEAHGFLPYKIQELIGLKYSDGSNPRGDVSLSTMNDWRDKTFSDIADYIEKTPEIFVD